MTLNLCSLAIGTRLRTRDGRSARLLATDLRNARSCVVAIDEGLLEVVSVVAANGRHNQHWEAHPDIWRSPADIVEIEECA